ncbi:MAG: putative colanic acid biosynthesis acetyltransferase [Terriglobales bacterium]
MPERVLPCQHMPVQDLKAFRLPPNFRGRPAWFVQLWWMVQTTLFRWSPQVAYGWRRWLLRRFGARIGKGAQIRPTAEITYPWKLTIGDWSWIGDYVTLYTLGEIRIGDNAVVSQHSYICAASHDCAVPTFDIFDDPVRIEAEAWIAAGVFVAPGVRVGRGAVVGARSVVMNDVPPMMVCAGHPAKVIRPRLAPRDEPAAGHSEYVGSLQA